MGKYDRKPGASDFVGAGNQPRIGDRLRERLSSGAVSIYAVSQATGLGTASLYKFMEGSDLRLSSVELLADFFDCEMTPSKKRRKS